MKFYKYLSILLYFLLSTKLALACINDEFTGVTELGWIELYYVNPILYYGINISTIIFCMALLYTLYKVKKELKLTKNNKEKLSNINKTK